jgi:hypothetical protein
MANFQDGIIRDGSSIGNGDILGNVKDGIIYKGTYPFPGNGDVLGNVKDGVIYKGTYPFPGNGETLGNVKDGIVYKGTYPFPGNGDNIGRVSDFKIEGMEREPEVIMVAAYHFLVKNIF